MTTQGTEEQLLLTVKDLQLLLQKGRSATYDVTRAPGFPRPLRIGKEYRWFRAEVVAWLGEQRVTERPARVRRAEVHQEPLFHAVPKRRTREVAS